ncbi:MAG: fumarylacetoacetate hydrolase family protein [Dehalococcoidia bacterium]|jgi:2-oxo-3-hexenedioate decarboxylase/2-keto-4-pentenoate hydratase|nr:hydratase [Chloroflexota bacterium]MDP6055742.1 fumarylacetoacetate hydrolase family protein [Dehalococcoidia bacterium]MDP7089755.1 fumarylacetoacetate hydrolase family protein [Dehalococcoidia bacterium]MDP7261719.1 fumarylacetoacetate hydrolase family protein [Dehalococcoidia bacterium]MDP7484725.1 fumarylacetoacetate hydrolase family protein [Dehalococcoidia bacterium]|tara:strand:+ start:3839 stop:4639 length:801 start_codon:yes stop_codon:yes gene_type:complete
MNQEELKQSAGILALTRVRNQIINGLPDEYRPIDEAEAYQVQKQLHALLDEAGYGKRVGYKIGCTTPVMQKFLGINNPCAGGIYNTATNYIAVSAQFDNFSHPGVECEIAAFIGDDLVPAADSTPFTRETVASAVQALFGAIEIVDDRWTDYKQVDTPTLIADDFFASGIVLSQPKPVAEAPDLATARGHMAINGNQVGEGTTGDILGHPYEALAWLANSLAERDQHLKSGEIVLLGSVVETQWVERGDEVNIEIEGVGGALVKFV